MAQTRPEANTQLQALADPHARPKNCSIEDPLPIRIVLDYYLKEMNTCADLANEEPRPAESFAFKMPGAEDGKGSPSDTDGEGLDAKKRNERKLRTRKETVAIRLNNNFLQTVADLPRVLTHLNLVPRFETNLMWLDLSFNQLTKIDKEILEFKALKILYLHGNKIEKLSQVEKLAGLTNLEKLTINANPELEKQKIYRRFTAGALPQIRSLDQTCVTKEENRAARKFYLNYIQLRAAAREKAQEKRDLLEAAAF